MSNNMVTESLLAGVDVENDIENAKQALRAQARARRSRRPEAAREEMALQWVNTVMDFLGDADVVAAYVSVNSEPPTHLIHDAIVGAGKKLLLPKLGPGLSRQWGWYRKASDLEVLAPGRPPEPVGPSIDSSILQEVDAMIIPALLIGPGGARLGQGGGWYDRVLKQVGSHTRVGAMVFPDEYVDDELPQDSMDRTVQYVILPHEWKTVGSDFPEVDAVSS